MRVVFLVVIFMAAGLPCRAQSGSAGGAANSAGSAGGYAVYRSSGGSTGGTLTGLRDRLRLRRQPTQAIGQDQVIRTRTRERSMLRQRTSAATPSPSGQPASSLDAPAAPAASPAEKTAPKPKDGASVSLSDDEFRMVSAINQYRAKYGLPALSPDPTLERVARSRVSVYEHQHPRFGWVWQHARSLGWPGPALNTTCTDDLCQGAPTPEEAVNGWAHSSVGHAEQMRGKASMNGKWEDCKFNLCGVAHQGQNYIAVFGRKQCNCQAGGDCTCGPNCNCASQPAQ